MVSGEIRRQSAGSRRGDSVKTLRQKNRNRTHPWKAKQHRRSKNRSQGGSNLSGIKTGHTQMIESVCALLFFYHMIRGAKDDSRIAPCFALSQSCPIFGIRGAPVSPPGSVVAKRLPLAGSNPLLPHIGAGHKAFPPLASELAVKSGF